MNANLQKGLKYVVIFGSALIAVDAAVEGYNALTKEKDVAKKAQKAVLPTVTLLIAMSAFSYALSGKEVKIVPNLKGA